MVGFAKHRKSGRSPKSPKLRHALKRQAEADTKTRNNKTGRIPLVYGIDDLV